MKQQSARERIYQNFDRVPTRQTTEEISKLLSRGWQACVCVCAGSVTYGYERQERTLHVRNFVNRKQKKKLRIALRFSGVIIIEKIKVRIVYQHK